MPSQFSHRNICVALFTHLIICIATFHFVLLLNSCNSTESSFAPPPHIRTPPQHIVIFTLDTVRQDHLGCYGNSQISTPTLDTLSRRGTLFQEATAASSWTIPSHASIFTSLFPRSHGAIFTHRRLEAGYHTAAELLKARNFYTAAFVAAKPTTSLRGFNQGFMHFDEKNVNPWREGALVTKRAIDWLRGTTLGENLFLWIHYFDAHRPYMPPPPFDRMYNPAKPNLFEQYFQKSKRLDSVLDRKKKRKAKRDGITLTPEIIARAHSLYMGEISLVDRYVWRILQTLQDKNVYQKSMIIVTGDHGEFFGEGGRYFKHATNVSEPVIRVPLIITQPGNVSVRTPLVTVPVHHVDILPTIWDIMALDTKGTNFVGKSLKNLINGRLHLREQFVFSEFHPKNKWTYYTVRGVKYKYVRMISSDKKNEFLFDLENSGTMVNLLKEKPEVRAMYSHMMNEWLKNTPQYKQNNEFIETEEMKEALRRLGYLDSK